MGIINDRELVLLLPFNTKVYSFYHILINDIPYYIPEKKEFAVGSQMNVEGEGYSPEDEDFAKEAYDISDEMIRFNYFGKK